MLSESLPPLRYRMTRLRTCAPCARARSERNSGAANVIVNAATPPLTNCRLLTFIRAGTPAPRQGGARRRARSEEHTSELQSPCDLVCRLLLEKKNKKKNINTHITQTKKMHI